MYTYGVFSVATAVIVHHIQVLMNTRNFSPFMVFWYFFSQSMLFIVLFVSDKTKNSFVRGGTYPVILSSPLIQAMLVVAITLCVIPLYVVRSYRRVYKYP